ncbi:SDR family NAD(P)-dependent oxidoreductase [Paracidovorax oryzae]|uniref:SDR family NAD(P)-dependent oxidoreductase n=1 Tax=Paracidovorax oryzae TaxID=862720 RepID=UPI0005529153|nr:SDR family oxidoreductase [Paracidovorax oryzae]
MKTPPDRNKVLILGASRGLGRSLLGAFGADGHTVTAVARRFDGNDAEQAGRILTADLTQEAGLASVTADMERADYDCIIYVAGIWERQGFERASEQEVRGIVATNITAPLIIGQRLLALCAAMPPRRRHYFLIGSTSGLDNSGSTSCAYVASKFALRGLTHSLREQGRPLRLHVTCLSPGSIRSDQSGQSSHPARIPPDDIYQLIRCILSLDDPTLVKELVVPAIEDTDV